MARRGFFWFSTKWLHYRVWPAWTWTAAKLLLAVFIAIPVAWGLAFLYFYLFPLDSLSNLRREIRLRADSVQFFQTKLSLLKQERSQIDSLERLVYRELTANPEPASESTGRNIVRGFGEGLRADTLAHYLERLQRLLGLQLQQEVLLQRLAKEVAYLPRHRPVEKGEIAAGFGSVYHPITMQPYEHRGIDFVVTPGTPVLGTADGIVREVSPLPFGENSYKVLVEHTPAFHTLYYPVDPLVQPGQVISRGTRIGYVTRLSTARTAFVHYEIWEYGQAVNPLPYLWGDLAVEEIAALEKAFLTPGHGLH